MAVARRSNRGTGGRESQVGAERVAAYARVSTEMQAEEGLSITAQLNEIREYAAGRGWTVVSEFVDAGITGQTLERPGLQNMLAAAEQGAFDIVVVHELSRLSRSSVYDTFAIFDHLGRCKVGFASVKEPQFDLSNPTGRFLLTIIAAINQYYIDILRMHTKKAKRERAREGLYNSSVPPYGYAHAGSPRQPPVIVPEEAEVVRFMFERYVTGRYSLSEITDMVNDRGWRTRAGRRFAKDTVNDMLCNPFYAGKVIYKAGQRARDAGEMFQGRHEAIISEEMWEASVRVRQRHQHRRRLVGSTSRVYLLSQLARCHLCGRNLRAQASETGGYYRELSYERGFDDCPNSRLGTRAEPLHKQVGAILRVVELPPDWQAELAEMIGDEEEVATLDNRRERLKAEQRRLLEAYVRGDFAENGDLYRRELERVRRELAALPSAEDLEQVEQAAVLLESLSEVWDDADLADQRELTQLMLREVRVDVAQGRLLLLYPTAPFIPLFRNIPLLDEREMGSFVPVWPPDMAEIVTLPRLPALTAVPEEPVALPFLPTWPWTVRPGTRISPSLSGILRSRRQGGHEGGVVVAVPHAGVPGLVVDHRKWPEVTLRNLPLGEAVTLPAGSVACLDTPLILGNQAEFTALLPQVREVLEDGGYWRLVDLMLPAMPAHWVFTYFPEVWAYVCDTVWSSYKFNALLREAGFGVRLKEHSFYQPVSLGAAYAIAQQRPGLLATLSDEAYQRGLERLAAECGARGAATQLGSEFTLVEILAVKAEHPKPPRKRRRPSFRKPGKAVEEIVAESGLRDVEGGSGL